MNKQILLVEGESDKNFFKEVLAVAGLSAKVSVAPPRDLQGKANNREGLLNHIPLLLKQFEDGYLGRLGIIFDADYNQSHGLGYLRVKERLSTILAQGGFVEVQPAAAHGALVYRNSAGFSDVGVWVMPGRRRDGMLEDWVKESIGTAEKALLDQAIAVVQKLKGPKFKELHTVKAEIATWLAWQTAPGRGLENAIKEDLLDQQSAGYRDMLIWLRQIFR